MRGGKREGSGRKGFGATKTIRIPIELEAKIKGLITEFKAKLDSGAGAGEKASFENVTESIGPIKPEHPALSHDQKKRLKKWLVDIKVARSKTQARKMTETPKQCHETFQKHIHLTEGKHDWIIRDIMELYRIE